MVIKITEKNMQQKKLTPQAPSNSAFLDTKET